MIVSSDAVFESTASTTFGKCNDRMAHANVCPMPLNPDFVPPMLLLPFRIVVVGAAVAQTENVQK